MQASVKDHSRINNVSNCVMVEPRISRVEAQKVIKSLGFPTYDLVDAGVSREVCGCYGMIKNAN